MLIAAHVIILFAYQFVSQAFYLQVSSMDARVEPVSSLYFFFVKYYNVKAEVSNFCCRQVLD